MSNFYIVKRVYRHENNSTGKGRSIGWEFTIVVLLSQLWNISSLNIFCLVQTIGVSCVFKNPCHHCKAWGVLFVVFLFQLKHYSVFLKESKAVNTEWGIKY